MNKQHYEREPNFQHMNLALKKKNKAKKIALRTESSF